MKKLMYFIAGAFLALAGTTAFATSNIFTDQDNFADWYESAVINMYDEGVITGYPDGSFGASSNVNRAELAVMLDRFEDLMDESIEYYFEHHIDNITDKIFEYTDTDYDYRAFLVVAESGMMELDEAPEYYGSSEWGQNTNANLPEGYSLYEAELAESGNPMYLYFEGEVCEEDVCGISKEQWYGPFYLPSTEY